MKLLNEWKPAHPAPLVQIAVACGREPSAALQEISGD